MSARAGVSRVLVSGITITTAAAAAAAVAAAIIQVIIIIIVVVLLLLLLLLLSLISLLVGDSHVCSSWCTDEDLHLHSWCMV